jgi:Cation transporter/ATPase, N-terminus
MHDGLARSPSQTFPFSVPPYLLSIEAVVAQLGTDIELGLSEVEVTSRQTQYGPNAVSLVVIAEANVCSWKEEKARVGPRFC